MSNLPSADTAWGDLEYTIVTGNFRRGIGVARPSYWRGSVTTALAANSPYPYALVDENIEPIEVKAPTLDECRAALVAEIDRRGWTGRVSMREPVCPAGDEDEAA